jgi:hypothetical protein
MSFLLDPPLLVASGVAVERLVPEEHRGLADAAVLGVFVGASYALYLDVKAADVIWKPWFRGEGGRDFMLRSGVLPRWPVRSERATDALAAAMFSLYPAWYVVGRRLGRRRG